MSFVLLVLLTTLFAVTVSQIQITADKSNVEVGERVVLTGTVPDFTDNVAVIQGTSSSRALCLPGLTCNTDTSAYSVTKTATNIIFTILSFSKARDVGSWFIRYGTSNVSNTVTLSEFTQSASTCDGNLRFCHWKSCLLFAVLCFIAPIVKIVIILCLWYNCRNCRRIPEDTYIRIIVTAQKKITKASQRINNEDEQDISLCNPCHEIIILVRAGVKIQCSFQVDGNAFTLSFEITEDMLNARPGKMIKLPTWLQVHPKYETIQWSFNRKELDCKDQYYKTKVSPATYGVYDIEMKFLKQVMISIQNMRVQGGYWKLMILFFVIDIVLAVICGTVTGLNRLKDGFCVRVIVIICVVLISWIFFTGVEMALIYFKLIKRTESKEGSGSQDSDMVKIKTSETRTGSPNAETTTFITRTGSPNAETTTFTTDVLSSSDVTATT